MPRRYLWLFPLAALPVAVLLACTPQIGNHCQLSTDCSQLGDRLCDTTQPEGYCTVFNCEPDSCPYAVCVAFDPTLDPACGNAQSGRWPRFERSYCLAPCNQDSDCRGSYQCVNLDPNLYPNMPNPAITQRRAQVVDLGAGDGGLGWSVCMVATSDAGPPAMPFEDAGAPPVCVACPGTQPQDGSSCPGDGPPVRVRRHRPARRRAGGWRCALPDAGCVIPDGGAAVVPLRARRGLTSPPCSARPSSPERSRPPCAICSATKADVRAGALRDLVAHADAAREQVVRALQRALREDEEAQVRAVAATALADLRADEALPDLLFAVEDPAPLVRQMAIAALGEIGDSRATERLRRALADERAEVRFQAVMAFPRVSADRKAALEALLHATTDEDPFVCHIALRMTEEVGDGGPPDERVLARARALLGDAGKSAEVRVASAILLARTGDARAVAMLTKVARGELRTRDAEDEAAAIELCGELGIEAAQKGLEKRAFGGLLGIGKRSALLARARRARPHGPRARPPRDPERARRPRPRRPHPRRGGRRPGAPRRCARAHPRHARRSIAAPTRPPSTRPSRRSPPPPTPSSSLGRRLPATMNEPRFSAADLEPSDDERRAELRALVDRIAAAVAVLAAGAWVGGMVALGACAAPMVFRLAPAPFSGDAMGAAFARFDQIALGAAVVLLGAEMARTWAAGARARTAAARVRRLAAVLMAACAAYVGLSLTPHILELHRAGAQRGVGPRRRRARPHPQDRGAGRQGRDRARRAAGGAPRLHARHAAPRRRRRGRVVHRAGPARPCRGPALTS